MASIEGTSLSYTGRDATDIKRELVSLVPELTEKWKDFSESDLGMTIIELIAGAQDLQNFYFDNQAFETFLDSAEQDKNIRSLLRAMNYRIPFMGSAVGTVDLYFTTDQADLVIPKYTQLICVNNDYKYAVKETTVINSTTRVDEGEYANFYKASSPLEVMEGTVRTFRITKAIMSNRLTLDGEITRRIYLENGDTSHYSDGSLWIQHKDAKGDIVEVWTEVDDAILEYNGGTVYSVHVDTNGEIYVLMSVNFMDYLKDTDEMIFYWVQTLGMGGIATPNTSTAITRFMSFKDNDGNVIRVQQTESTSGAYDIPKLSTLKPLARRQAQNIDRYITIDDYKNGVETEPYIFRYVVKDWKSPAYVDLPYQVKIWALNHQGTNLNSVDVKKLKNKFYTKGVTDIEIVYVPTEFVNIYLEVKLILKVSSESNRAEIRNLVRNNLFDMLDYTNMNYGQHISLLMLDSQIKAMSPYIKDTEIHLYLGEIVKLKELHDYDTKYAEKLEAIETSRIYRTEEVNDVLNQIRDIIDVPCVMKLHDDYNLNDLLNDILSLKDTNVTNRRDYKDRLDVIVWRETGDVSLDEIQYPYRNEIHITSTQADPGVEL